MKQLKKAYSMKKKPSKTYFKLEELEAIAGLLNAGLSINDALCIIKNKYNRLIINELENRLMLGDSIEKIFTDYLNKEYHAYFKAFISYLSFSDSLTLLLSIKAKEVANKEKTLKELTYPLMMLLGVMIAVILFNGFCFDALIDTMSVFRKDLSYLVIFKEIIDILIHLIIVISLIVLLLIIYFTRRKRIVLSYVLLQKYCPRSMIKEYLSSIFITYYLECLKLGIKTKDSIEILKTFKHQPLISFLAFHIDEAFLSGKDMKEAMKNPYLDARLSRFINIAIYSNDIERMLETYLRNFELRFNRYCQHIAKSIQLFSYLTIGIVIIFIYQILFIPMSIIGGF